MATCTASEPPTSAMSSLPFTATASVPSSTALTSYSDSEDNSPSSALSPYDRPPLDLAAAVPGSIYVDPSQISSNSPLSGIPALGRPVNFGKSYTVYQGFYGPARTKVAIKRLRILGEDSYSRKVKHRIEREAKLRSSLIHDNILPFYGMFESSREAYMIYPWMELGDLSSFLIARLEYLNSSSVKENLTSSAPYSAFSAFDEAKTIRGIMSGLAYLHANGVIHGDLKADNILLNNSLIPLISDFGLTKNGGPDDITTATGLDAPRWTSPGLLDAKDPQKTEKSDIYAFGMTITEVLTGHVPFYNLTSSFHVYKAVVLENLRPPFEPLSRNGRDFRSLWNLAAWCWQKDPMNRPTADDVMHRLGTHADVPVDRGDQSNTDSTAGRKTHVVRLAANVSDRARDSGLQGIPGNEDGLSDLQVVPPLHLDPFPTTEKDAHAYEVARPVLSSQDSDAISMLPPGKTINFSNCVIFRVLQGPTPAIFATRSPRVLDCGKKQDKDAQRLHVKSHGFDLSGMIAPNLQEAYERDTEIWSPFNHGNMVLFNGILSVAYLIPPWIENGCFNLACAIRFQRFDVVGYIRGHDMILGDLQAADVTLHPDLQHPINGWCSTKSDVWYIAGLKLMMSGRAWWNNTCLSDNLDTHDYERKDPRGIFSEFIHQTHLSTLLAWLIQLSQTRTSRVASISSELSTSRRITSFSEDDFVQIPVEMRVRSNTAQTPVDPPYLRALDHARHILADLLPVQQPGPLRRSTLPAHPGVSASRLLHDFKIFISEFKTPAGTGLPLPLTTSLASLYGHPMEGGSRPMSGYQNRWSERSVRHCLAWSPESQRIIPGYADVAARLWESSTEALDGETQGCHTDTIDCVTWSPDGNMIVTRSHDFTIRLWESSTGALIEEAWKVDEATIFSMTCPSDSRRVVFRSTDRTSRVWDPCMGALVGETWTSCADDVFCVAQAPDGNSIASGSHDDICLSTRTLIWKAYHWSVCCLAWSPDGKMMVCGDGDCCVCLRDGCIEEPVRDRRGYTGPLLCLAWSPDGKPILSGSTGFARRLWSSSTGASVEKTWEDYISNIRRLSWPSENNMFVPGSDSDTRLLCISTTVTFFRFGQPRIESACRGLLLHPGSMELSP
ncbi:hypothetical protein FRB95_005656 [Tulasnella sp. JGI-2019a]|nr:hypothetical protein FRB95_005656 [Tulasnella sp. JGI-2019a]